MSATLCGLRSRCVRAGGLGTSLNFYIILSTCAVRMGAADKTGWHLWILFLDLDQPASLFFYMLVLPFTWTITNSGGFSERGRTVA